MTSSSVGRWASQGCRRSGLRDRSPTRKVRTANPGRSTHGPPPARVVVRHEPIVEGPGHPSAPRRARCGAGLPRGADDATRAVAPEARAAVARHRLADRGRPRRGPHADGAAGRLPHHVHRRTAARHGPLTARRAARADPAAGPPPAREDHPLRPRAHPRAGRARARRRRPRHLRRRTAQRRTSRWPRSSQTDVETPVFVRFSTVAGSRGSADTVRDTRGFAVKFYTDEGNFDLVGNNIPVFFIQDGIKFPDLIHAAKPQPDREIPQAQIGARHLLGLRLAASPKPSTMLIWAMSDRAIPRSYRMMEGFGVHTFRLVNAEGETTLGQVPLEAAARRALAGLGGGAARSAASTPTSTAATSTTPSRRAPSRSGSSASRSSPTPTTRPSRASTCSTPPSSCPRSSPPCSRSGADAQPATRRTSSPRPSRSPSTSATSCPASTSPTTRCCRRGCSPTSTPSSPGSAGPNFNQIPINRPHAPVNDMLRDGMHQTPSTAAWRPTARTRSTVAARSWPGDAEGALHRRAAGAWRRAPGCASSPRRSTTTSARPGCSGGA